MNIWKRNAVVAVVILFICVAVYLNWSYNRGQELPDAYADSQYEEFEAGKTLGETALVNQSDDSGIADVPVAETSAPEEENKYFAQARLTRQQSRDSALALLRETAGRDSAGADARSQAEETIGQIAKNALSEARIENLVKAKGFDDCVAFISDDGINIVVSAPQDGLKQSDVAKIKDIAQSETGLKSDKIKIVPVQ